MKERLQKFVNGYGLGISKEKLIGIMYHAFSVETKDTYIINDRYLHIDGIEYQLIKSKKENRWLVKEF